MRLLASVVLACGLFLLPLTVMAQPGAGEERPFIDLDGDGTTDFALERTMPVGHETTTGQYVKIVPNGDNQLVRQNDTRYLMGFKKDDLIGGELPDSLTWVSETTILYYGGYNDNTGKEWTGDWPNAKSRYLGLKLIKGENVYYGWAHVHVDTTKLYGTVRLRESRYNPHPGQPIRAGHKP